MTDRHEDTDARLARLRNATAAVGPRAAFAHRVAATIAREGAEGGWLGELFRPARRLVPLAAVAAAVGVLWAAESAPAWRSTAGPASPTELDTEW